MRHDVVGTAPLPAGHTCSVEHFRLLSVLHVKSAGGCVFFPSFSVLPRHYVVGEPRQGLTRSAVENKRVCGTVFVARGCVMH